MRQPWNIFVFIFRKRNDKYEYALLKRKDDGIWQGVAGGGEENETYEDAANREIFEETKLISKSKLYKLTTLSYIEASIFKQNWDDSIIVVPMYYYAINIDDNIIISNEHTQYKWADYEKAINCLYWHDNKVALYELNERLKRNKQI